MKYRLRLAWVGDFYDEADAREAAESIIQYDVRVLNHVQEGRIVAELHELPQEGEPRAINLRCSQ